MTIEVSYNLYHLLHKIFPILNNVKHALSMPFPAQVWMSSATVYWTTIETEKIFVSYHCLFLEDATLFARNTGSYIYRYIVAVPLNSLFLESEYEYSWVNQVCPKNWGAYFSAISRRKFDLTAALRWCWPIEWGRRGFIASGPFFSLFLVWKPIFSGQRWFLRPYYPLIRGMFFFWKVVLYFHFGHWMCKNRG